MVDMNGVPPTLRPYTGPIQTNNNQQTGQVNTGEGTPTTSTPAQTEESSGILGGISSFFKKIGNAIEAAFSPVDKRVKDADFRPNPNYTPGATTAASNVGDSSGVPNPKASFEDLKKYVQPAGDLNYFEIERGNVNAKLGQYLNQFKQQLDANPQLREQLGKSEIGKELLAALDAAGKGQIGTDQILALQKFAVASGQNIGYPGNAGGIDGQYGAKTHEGLQKAFESLLADPTAGTQALETNAGLANQGVEALRTAQDGEIDRYVPGQSEALPDASPTAATGERPQPTDLGRRIWESAQQTAREMGNNGYCMKGVRTTMDRIGIPIRDANGNNLRSAYMAADVLAQDSRFREVQVSRSDLRNLPPGAIVVWDRNPDPAKRAANPDNGYSHGHIEVIGPNGQAISDGLQSWGVTMNNNGRYGGFRVFIPNS